MAVEPRLRASFKAPFDEQIAALRLRFADLRPTQAWTDLWQAEHDRAFVVAGALKADLLADLAAAVDRAASEGRGLEAFRQDFRRIVEMRGWHGWTGEGTEKGEAWRTRVIWQTNLATSHAAGRRAQLVKAGFRFWVYKHGGSRDPRPQHLAWDGLVLPPDHPFWATHAPPNGWGCSCYVVGANGPAGIRAVGGDPAKQLPDGWAAPDPKTGAPKGIDKGWAYAPGASVVETVQLAGQKIAAQPPRTGADFGASLDGVIDRAWPVWLEDVRARRDARPTLAGTLSRTVLDALEARGIAPASAEIMVRPGLIVGPKADRHERAGDGLKPEDWEMLPQSIRRPTGILRDNRTGALLYIMPTRDGAGQLAIRLDYALRSARSTIRTNVIVSAYRTGGTDLAARLAGGLVELLIGAVG